MNHTRGPWRISAFEQTVASRTVMGGDDYSVAYCDGRWPKENLANAVLIAAAPDLLEALRASRKAMDSRCGDHCRNNCEFCAIREQVVNAIAKAEGKQS